MFRRGGKKSKKEEVVPGIEPGLLVSETRVIAITLHNQFFLIEDSRICIMNLRNKKEITLTSILAIITSTLLFFDREHMIQYFFVFMRKISTPSKVRVPIPIHMHLLLC